MADIQYLNYGDLQIELLALLNNLANQVQDYVNKQSWSNKRKEKFMSAYSDLMNRGIQGASNSTGLWVLNVGGDEPVPLDTMSKKDKEMYQEAAYFIQQQMAALPTKASKEEEKPEEELKLFDASEFDKGFKTHVNKTMSMGFPLLIGGEDDQWNYLDERDSKTGLRGRTNRANKLAELLKGYSDSIDFNKYKFDETSPFKDADDFKGRINTAIKALTETPDDINDDTQTLNALGIKASDWFNNGSGDLTDYVDKDGKRYTYGQYYGLVLPELEKAKQKEALEKLKIAKLNAYNNATFIGFKTSSKMHGASPTLLKEKYGNHLTLLLALYGYSLKTLKELTPQELSELHGAYRFLAKNPIDDKTLKTLLSMSSGLYRDSAPNRFKKINGINNLVYDTLANQVILLLNRQLFEASKNTPEDLFAGIKTKEDIQNTPISKEGWTSADTADVVSMVGDLVSLGGFWANIGGTATSLTSDLYADITRGKDLGDILKGIGVNLGWGLAGMLPGAKSTKVAARAARLVPKAFMLAQSAGIVLDPEVLKSALKFTNPSEYKNISSKDLENLKYLFHAVTGGANIAKSHYRAKLYRETINKLEFKTADGKTVKLSNKQVAEINKAGRKGGQKAALDKFEEYAKTKSAEGQFKFSEKGKSKFNPARYSSKLSKFTSNDLLLKGEKTTDLRALSNILREDTNKPWYNWNKGYAKHELTPFRHSSNYKNNSQQKESVPVLENNSLPEQPNNNPRDIQFNRATINRYKEYSKGNFSNKTILEGKLKIGDKEMTISSTKDERRNRTIYDIHFNGKHFYNLTQDKVKKQVFELVKENRKLVDKDGKVNKKSTKEIGKILLDLKRKGWLKQGGTIDKQRIQQYKNFINK